MKRSLFPTDLSALVPSRIVLAMCIAGVGTCFAAPPNTVEEAARIVAAVTDPDPIKQTQKRAEKAREILQYRIGAIDVYDENHIPPPAGVYLARNETVEMWTRIAANEVWAEKDRKGGDSASCAWALRMGTCTEHSELMMQILRGAGEKCVKLSSTNNHTFVVVNYAGDADSDLPSTWGPNAQVSDSWLRKTLTPRTIWAEERAFGGGKYYVSPDSWRKPGDEVIFTTREWLRLRLAKGPAFINKPNVWPEYAARMRRVPVEMRRTFTFPDGTPAPDPDAKPGSDFGGDWVGLDRPDFPTMGGARDMGAQFVERSGTVTGTLVLGPSTKYSILGQVKRRVKEDEQKECEFTIPSLTDGKGRMRLSQNDQVLMGDFHWTGGPELGSTFSLMRARGGQPPPTGSGAASSGADHDWVVGDVKGDFAPKRAKGERVGVGDMLKSGPGATLKLRSSTGGSMCVQENTAVCLKNSPLQGGLSQSVWDLSRGELLAEGNGSAADLDLSVRTPNALVMPLGTRYNVRFEQPKQTTTVTVSAGSVRVTPTLTSQQPALCQWGLPRDRSRRRRRQTAASCRRGRGRPRPLSLARRA
jgi:hypothetical protein